MRKKTDPEYTKVIKIKQCRSKSVLLDLDKAIWAPCLLRIVFLKFCLSLRVNKERLWVYVVFGVTTDSQRGNSCKEI